VKRRLTPPRVTIEVGQVVFNRCRDFLIVFWAFICRSTPCRWKNESDPGHMSCHG
jgi:hypothetical protein